MYKKILLFILVSVIGLISLEIFIGSVSPQKTTKYHKSVSVGSLLRYGVERPTELRADMDIRISDLYKEFDVSVITDSYGFRRSEKASVKEPSVLVVGDSQTFGHGVSNIDAYPNILDDRYPECQVINAGVPGTGLNYYFAYIRKVVGELEFTKIKGVIVGLNMPGNDWYGMHSQSKKIDPELTHYTEKSPDHNAKRTVKWHIERILRNLQTYSFLRETIAPRVKRVFVSKFIDNSERDNDEYEELGPSTTQLIEDMNKFGRERNIPIYFLLLPERPHYFKYTPSYMQKIRQFMNEENISYIDLVPPMSKRYKRFSDFWLPINGHYNEDGHRIIADEIENSGIMEVCEENKKFEE
jgi:hypothetical protein